MRDTHISPGFTGRRREGADPSRIPPGQYAGPTPHTPLDQWTFTIDRAVDAAGTWTWKEFLALPHETPTLDIDCVTKWSKLDTSWRGISVRRQVCDRRAAGPALSPGALTAPASRSCSRVAPPASPATRSPAPDRGD